MFFLDKVSFTFTFFKGLKFPSGVELKETITWRYNPENQTFSVVAEGDNTDSAGFTVYYNGQKITKENNLVTIYDKKSFNLDYLSVYAESIDAVVEVKPQFEVLSEGYNYVLITVTSNNRVDFEHIQVVFDLQQTKEEKSAGCSAMTPLLSSLTLLPACALIMKKRGKRA